MTRRGPRRLWARAALTAMAVAGLVSCGSSSGDAAGTGRVTVFAASSLTDAFPAIAAAFRRDSGGAGATLSFAGSQELVAQIAHGAPADVVATADPPTMRRISDQLVEPARTLARNRLVIVTAPGNPHHLESLADLESRDLVVVLADPSVPAGGYAQVALTRAHVHLSPRSLEPDVRGVLTKVELGAADAGIVYRTDALAAGSRVASIAIPSAPVASYKIGALDDRGRAFVRFALSPEGQRILQRFGFST